MSDQVRQFTVRPDDDGIRLDRWFKRHLPQIGFATVSRWARTGQIRVDGKRAKPEDRVVTGQTLRVPPGGDPKRGKPQERPELTEAQLAKADAMVITQDRAAIVLNKLPGLATQGGSGVHEHVDGLLDAFATGSSRPRLVHRLDKDTSGVLLIARTAGNAAFFSKRFSGRSAKKVYWALVVGVPEIYNGTIEAPLSKQPGSGGERMYVDEKEGKPAKTKYRVIERAGHSACWVELQPLTGRTHQLRVHMAAIGHPIVGDGKYGGQESFLTGNISRKMHLHARRLVIDHPDGTPLDVTAELPEHFASSMEHMGFDLSLADELPDDEPTPPTRAIKKQAARAHSKQIRKERRGERRGRGERGDDRKPRGARGENSPRGPSGDKKARGNARDDRPGDDRPRDDRPRDDRGARGKATRADAANRKSRGASDDRRPRGKGTRTGPASGKPRGGDTDRNTRGGKPGSRPYGKAQGEARGSDRKKPGGKPPARPRGKPSGRPAGKPQGKSPPRRGR